MNRVIWKKYWGFKTAEINLLRPIVSQLTRYGFGPDFDLHLGIVKKEFHKVQFLKLESSLKKDLAPLGFSIPALYKLIQPAAFFHSLWFYQLCRRNDSMVKEEGKLKHQAHIQTVRDAYSGAFHVSEQVKLSMLKALNKNTMRNGFGMPDLEVCWSKDQIALLGKYLGHRLLRGEQVRTKKKPLTYLIHKAPFWRMTMQVLVARMGEKGKPRSKREIYRIVYKFLYFIFPDVFYKPWPENELKPLDEPRPIAFEAVRNRIRYTPPA